MKESRAVCRIAWDKASAAVNLCAKPFGKALCRATIGKWKDGKTHIATANWPGPGKAEACRRLDEDEERMVEDGGRTAVYIL